MQISCLNNRCKFSMIGFLSLSTVLHLFALLLLLFLFENQPLLQPVVVDLSMDVGKPYSASSTSSTALGKSAKPKQIKAVSQQVKQQSVFKPEPLQPVLATKPVKQPPVTMASVADTAVTSESNTVNTTKLAESGEQVSGTVSGASSNSVAADNGKSTDSSGGAGSSAQVQQRYLQENFSHVRDKIMGNLSYPPLARRMNWSGRTLISFRIALDGSISNLKVKEGSGHEVLDRAALDTVKKSAPFPKPAFPVEIVVPVSFKLI